MKILQQLILTTVLVFTAGATFGQNENEQTEPFSQAELEQILAPIALYPDTVLSHILIASTYPLEVIQAERWTAKNTDLKGSEAVEAVVDYDWDASVKALVAFPQILKRLSEDLDWTRKLGDAFLQDEERLLASVQSLRKLAYEAGSLDDMEKARVTHEDDSIIIEPVEREVVYVPYYDTRVVYGPWHWSHYPPVYWDYPYANLNFGGYYNDRRHHSPFYWGPRIHLSFGFFFSSLHWRNHHVVRIPYQHHRPHQYYDRHQIARHQQAERWRHNPAHRKGVGYRNAYTSDLYRNKNFGTRPNQAEVQIHRNAEPAASRQYASSKKIAKGYSRKGYTLEQKFVPESSKTRGAFVATKNEKRPELRDENLRTRPANSRYKRTNSGQPANAYGNKLDTPIVTGHSNKGVATVHANNSTPRPVNNAHTPRQAPVVKSQPSTQPQVRYSAPAQAKVKHSDRPTNRHTNSTKSPVRKNHTRPR